MKKIAIPVKMNRENPPLAPLFGKANWFAMVENGKVEIVKNPAHGGGAVVAWLLEEGVDTLIFQEMGVTPFRKLEERNLMQLYHAGFERILLNEVLEKFENGTLQPIDDTQKKKIIAHHERKHSHGTHHH